MDTASSAMAAGRVVVVGEGPDADRVTLITQSLAWPCISAGSARQAMRIVREDASLDMVIVVPGEAFEPYVELCRSIKFDRRMRFVWVIFILPPQHSDRGDVAMDAGADDCIRTIANDREVLLRLVRARQLKHATDLLEDAETVVVSLAGAVEGKDPYTCGHVERVGTYSAAIGRKTGLPESDLATLRKGGTVHDIGKIGIPDQILNKPGKLTDDELAIMRRHPLIGHDILKPLRTFQSVLPIVRWHHEKPNGKGYPDGIGGNDLPLLARIAAVADVFDAIITDRPYRKGFPIERCKQILLQDGVNGDLDLELVKVMLSILDGGLTALAA